MSLTLARFPSFLTMSSYSSPILSTQRRHQFLPLLMSYPVFLPVLFFLLFIYHPKTFLSLSYSLPSHLLLSLTPCSLPHATFFPLHAPIMILSLPLTHIGWSATSHALNSSRAPAFFFSSHAPCVSPHACVHFFLMPFLAPFSSIYLRYKFSFYVKAQ